MAFTSRSVRPGSFCSVDHLHFYKTGKKDDILTPDFKVMDQMSNRLRQGQNKLKDLCAHKHKYD